MEPGNIGRPLDSTGSARHTEKVTNRSRNSSEKSKLGILKNESSVSSLKGGSAYSEIFKSSLTLEEFLQGSNFSLRQNPLAGFLKNFFPGRGTENPYSLVSLKNTEEVKVLLDNILPKELAVFSRSLAVYLFQSKLPLEYLLLSYYRAKFEAEKKEYKKTTKKIKKDSEKKSKKDAEYNLKNVPYLAESKNGEDLTKEKTFQKDSDAMKKNHSEKKNSREVKNKTKEWELLFNSGISRLKTGEELIFYRKNNFSLLMFSSKKVRGYVSYNNLRKKGNLVFYAADRDTLQSLITKRHNLIEELKQIPFSVENLNFFHTIALNFDYLV